jgi:hypothetical protein
MEDIRDPEQRRELIERLRRERVELAADMQRRLADQCAWGGRWQRRREPEPSPPMRATGPGGIIYRDYPADRAGEAGAGEDDAKLDTVPEQEIDWSNWERWLADRIARVMAERDAKIATLQRQVARLETRLIRKRRR